MPKQAKPAAEKTTETWWRIRFFVDEEPEPLEVRKASALFVTMPSGRREKRLNEFYGIAPTYVGAVKLALLRIEAKLLRSEQTVKNQRATLRFLKEQLRRGKPEGEP